MIVGIYSPVPQSGKSIVRDFFVARGYQHLSFAEPVKQALLVVLEALGVLKPREYLWGAWKHLVIPELGVTGGQLMSTFATDYFRDTINADTWLKCAEREIEPGVDYVIDDMRFPNEWTIADFRIYLQRPNAPTHNRSERSEGQLDGYPFELYLMNDGAEADLLEKLEYYFNEH